MFLERKESMLQKLMPCISFPFESINSDVGSPSKSFSVIVASLTYNFPLRAKHSLSFSLPPFLSAFINALR